ncbi:hypothetical protein QT383_15675 [Stenotrophomonas rhizophila]
MKRAAAPLTLLLLFCPLPLFAQSGSSSLDMGSTVVGAGFMDSHPDMMYRQWGVASLHRGDPKGAMENFRLSARYADKPSQGYLGEMYWFGVEMPSDPVMAFAWMDVAAERGYPLLSTFVTSTGRPYRWSSTPWRALEPASCVLNTAMRLPSLALRRCSIAGGGP